MVFTQLLTRPNTKTWQEDAHFQQALEKAGPTEPSSSRSRALQGNSESGERQTCLKLCLARATLVMSLTLSTATVPNLAVSQNRIPYHTKMLFFPHQRSRAVFPGSVVVSLIGCVTLRIPRAKLLKGIPSKTTHGDAHDKISSYGSDFFLRVPLLGWL